MENSKKLVFYWLGLVCLMIISMIIVGGVTRLTDSGLSMVEWRPLLGTLPPLTDIEWQRVFQLYKNYPEYELINKGMTLTEFKYIFFWEYAHRVLGRLIGVAYLIPLLTFQFSGVLKKIGHNISIKLWLGFVLGGLQGLMGWYMVKSGLVDRPDVSHFRLAAHFMLALLIFAYLFWIMLDLMGVKKKQNSKLYFVSMLFISLVTLQTTFGAFTAGLKAGYGYNTFPLMNGSVIPPEALSLSPFVANLFENSAMIQFLHRSFGWTMLVFAVYFLLVANKISNNKLQKNTLYTLSAFVLMQFLLGVATLLLFVPTKLASIHQAGAIVVLAASVFLLRSTRKAS